MTYETTPADDDGSRQTFKTTFFQDHATKNIKIPDYQRAYAWDKKQLDLFIGG